MIWFEETWRQYKSDHVDIDTRLSDAVAQLYPHYEPEEDDLFAFDGLGREPRMPNVRGDR